MKNIKRCHDLTGQKFGRLTVVGLDDKNTRKTYWICQCECGGIKSARSDSLLCGAIKSCGCMKKEQDRINLEANHSHKQSGTRIYHIWQGMKARCYNVNDSHFHRYGGRGIVVCEEWKYSFQAFYEWAINNGYSEDLTIDRINNDGNYEPSNCRWATPKEQANNRNTNIYITIGNETKTLLYWCNMFKIDYRTVLARYWRSPNVTLDELFKANTEVTDRPSAP